MEQNNIDVIELKQFAIVPKSLKMSAGKMASQVAHATFMALEKQHNKEIKEKWKKSGMCVIVLECDNVLQLMGIAKYLEQWKVVHHMYIDEGCTEVLMGTLTALATGVLPLEYHWMFKMLKLFK